MTYLCAYTSPIGMLTLASNGTHLIGAWFDGQKYDRATISSESIFIDANTNKALQCATHWLDLYFSGQIPDFMPPLLVDGSAFQQLVLDVLLHVPYSQTRTYGEVACEVAQRMGRTKMSAQAVGGAIGHNPIAIFIPCHRIVGANGALTGYAAGVERKQWLLKHEQRTIEQQETTNIHLDALNTD